jgi:hypothetical protein
MGMPANSAGLAWSASGSERMRLTSTGLGIGTSSPTSTLTVNGSANVTGNTTLGDASTDTVTVNGYMGVGGAANAATGLALANSALTGGTQVGASFYPVFTSAATSAGYAGAFRASTAAASYTMSSGFGLAVLDAVKGAGSTITNQHGIQVADQTQGTNNYGITSLVSSGSNKWNIYASGTAANYFAGNVLAGTTTSRDSYVGAVNIAPILQAEGSTAGASSLSLTRTADASPRLFLNNAATVVAGSGLGQIIFSGSDGTQLRNGASILAEVDGTPGSADMPGRLVFSTTPDGASSPTERLRLGAAEAVFNDPGNDYDFRVESDTNTHALFVQGSDGFVGIGTSSPGNRLHVVGSGDISRFTNGSVSLYGYSDSSGLGWFTNTGATGTGVYYNNTSNFQAFYTASTERMRISDTGNLGLGVTPSAWGSSHKAIQNPAGSLSAYLTSQLGLNQNAYDSGIGTFLYLNTAAASRYLQVGGQHIWYTAPSGTAGNAISFTQAMTLSSSATRGTLDVNGASNSIYTLSTAGVRRAYLHYNGTEVVLANETNNPMVFITNNTERMRLDASGNLGLGVTPSAWASGARAIQILPFVSVSCQSNGNANFGFNFYEGGSNTFNYVTTDEACRFSALTTGGFGWFTAPSGTAGAAISFTQAMTLTAAGDLGIGTSSPVYKVDALFGAGSGNILRVGQTGISNGYAITTNGSALTHVWSNTGGDAMRLDASGNLGLGVTPSAWYDPTNGTAIQVGSSSLYNYSFTGNHQTHLSNNAFLNASAQWIYINSHTATRYEQGTNFSGGHAWFTAPSGTAGNAISFSQVMTLDASGNWMVGTTTAIGRATVVGGSSQLAFHDGNGSSGNSGLLNYGGNSGELTLNANSSGGNTLIRFLTSNGGSNAERARITSGGNLLVGTTSSLSAFSGARATFVGTTGFVAQTNQDASYECGAFWHPATSGNNTFAIFGTEATYTTRGSITYNRAGGLVAYNTTSDYRAKDIIGPVINPGATIDALKVYEGRMKGATQSRPMLVAHEAQAVAPYSVTGEKDAVNENGTPKFQQMDVSSLVPLLIAELQSLRARVAALESK